MKSVGEKLRCERVNRGMDLATLAGMTRISARYLEAIESGNTDNLPGGFFYRSFVRQYATALDMNLEEIENDLERAREAEVPILTAALQQAEFPTRQPDPIVAESNRRLSSARVWVYVVALAAVLVGCTMFYAWWRRLETTAAAGQDPTQEVATPAAPPAADVSAAKSSEPQQPPPIGVPVSPSAPAATTPPPVQSAASVSPAAGDAGMSPDHRVVLNLTATEMVWVSVTADGKSVFTGVINANETRTMGGREQARIRVGNAGGLAITWNGKSIGAIGPRGQVRTVVLTPDSYQIITPVPTPAERPAAPQTAPSVL